MASESSLPSTSTHDLYSPVDAGTFPPSLLNPLAADTANVEQRFGDLVQHSQVGAPPAAADFRPLLNLLCTL